MRNAAKWMALVALVAGLGVTAWAMDEKPAATQPAGCCAMKTECPTDGAKAGACPKAGQCGQALAEIAARIDSAKVLTQTGDTDAAVAELAKAQEVLAGLKAKMEACPMRAKAQGFANTHCPIMGGKIDPAKVTSDLTREFQGKTIAFCCAGCPAQWDKLSDAEKQAKLNPPAEAAPAKPEAHTGHH